MTQKTRHRIAAELGRDVLHTAARTSLSRLEWRALAAVVSLLALYDNLEDTPTIAQLAEEAGFAVTPAGDSKTMRRLLLSLHNRNLIVYEPGCGRGQRSRIALLDNGTACAPVSLSDNGTACAPGIASENGTGSARKGDRFSAKTGLVRRENGTGPTPGPAPLPNTVVPVLPEDLRRGRARANARMGAHAGAPPEEIVGKAKALGEVDRLARRLAGVCSTDNPGKFGEAVDVIRHLDGANVASTVLDEAIGRLAELHEKPNHPRYLVTAVQSDDRLRRAGVVVPDFPTPAVRMEVSA